MLAGLGLASVTFGAWVDKYRFFFVGLTMSLLGLAFWRTYSGRGNTSPFAKRLLWVTAAVSLGLTAYSLYQGIGGN